MVEGERGLDGWRLLWYFAHWQRAGDGFDDHLRRVRQNAASAEDALSTGIALSRDGLRWCGQAAVGTDERVGGRQGGEQHQETRGEQAAHGRIMHHPGTSKPRAGRSEAVFGKPRLPTKD